MSTLRVTIEPLEIHPHPNADALELAQVGMLRAVVMKGAYRTGDYALYIPEQSILPAELITELGLDGRLSGSGKNRVKPVRLRGELSQGIVCRPKALGMWPHDGQAVHDVYFPDMDPAVQSREGTDYADMLGITKWQPTVPAQLRGIGEPAPDLIRWINIENIKRYPGLFTEGEQVVATEKIHGTCCLLTYVAATGEVLVSSKGVGGRQLSLKEDPANLYWRAVHRHAVPAFAAVASGFYANRFPDGITAVGIFGEVYGAGVQDLHYGASTAEDDTIGYAMFDIAVRDGNGRRHWLTHTDINRLYDAPHAAATTLGFVPRVPVVYQGPYDYARLLELANQPASILDPGTLREGIVVRPATERESPVTGSRAIGKLVSDGYLTRSGPATEFE